MHNQDKNASSVFTIQNSQIQLRLTIYNNEIFLVLLTSITEKKLVFLVDTGSQISILKAEKILDAKIDTRKAIEIMGIANNKTIKSLGVTKASLNCNNTMICHDFHVMHENAFLRTDGILGADFLLKYNTNIDIAKATICLNLSSFSRSNTDEKSTRCICSPLISQSETQDDDEKYFNAVNDYIKYESTMVNQIRIKANNKNKRFYDEISLDYFKKYEIIKPEKVSVWSESDIVSVRNVNINKPFEINYINDTDKPIVNPLQRQKYIMSKIDVSNLNEQQIERISKVCFEFSEAFYIPNDLFKPTPVYKHSIKLKPNADVVCIKQYRIPFGQRDELQRQVESWEKMNIIQKSTSRFNSPLMLVKKHPDSDGKQQYRAVLDYKQLNKICIPQLYPLPLPEELFDMLHGSCIYTVLDVYAAYHQVELEESCRYLTAFSALNHHYEFKMLPFGMQSSGVGWLYAIHRVLQKFLNKNVFVYVDDVCLWSSNMDEHIALIKRVLKQLIRCNIKLKAEKCKFVQNHIRYLGYKISKKGLEIDEQKTLCIEKYPIPKNLKELQRFIGFVNFYRKYIPEFSRIALPLYKLCKKDIVYTWSEQAQIAFDTLRQKLMNPPVLAYPRFDLPFVVISDASNYAAAAILANRDGKEERPIQFFSRTFNDAQTRYSTVHKELLAAVWGITWFRSFLLGRPFYLVVDQKSLIYILSGKYKDTRVHRWAIELMEYDFEVIHREGKSNCADALSRIRINEDELTRDEKQKFVLLVQTRSKTEKIRQKMHQKQDTKSAETDKNKFFHILEKRGFLANSKEYDHITFFIHNNRCRLFMQLQHKLKKVIEITNLEYGEILRFENNKSILRLPKLIVNKLEIDQAERSIQTLKSFATQNGCEKLAINIDITHNLSYLQFKKIVRTIFSDSQIEISLFLNQIIQINDPNEINKILIEFHDTLSAGHIGWNKMYNSIKKYYNWPNMVTDIKNYTINCEICQKSKITRHTKQPIIISSTPTTSFAHIAIDHVGKIITSAQGNSYILTVICILTKYAIAIPVPDTGAEAAARALVEKVFLIYGYPEKITSDNHKTFESGLFKNINKLLKIHHVFTSPFTPKSNTVERFHSTLGNMLRAFVSNDQLQWETKLPYVVSAYNCSINTTTNRSPFELVFGKNMALPFSIRDKQVSSYNYDDFATELRENLKFSWNFAREKLKERKNKNKEYFDSKNNTANLALKIGEYVLMRNTNKKSKYDQLYVGPYEIVEISGPNTVKLKRKKKIIRAHKDQLKLFKKQIPNESSDSEINDD